MTGYYTPGSLNDGTPSNVIASTHTMFVNILIAKRHRTEDTVESGVDACGIHIVSFGVPAALRTGRTKNGRHHASTLDRLFSRKLVADAETWLPKLRLSWTSAGQYVLHDYITTSEYALVPVTPIVSILPALVDEYRSYDPNSDSPFTKNDFPPEDILAWILAVAEEFQP